MIYGLTNDNICMDIEKRDGNGGEMQMQTSNKIK